ncbi:unnamed protein product, partial [Litomosoides sigmodontis]
SMTVAEVTSILRFPGQMDSDLAKFIGVMELKNRIMGIRNILIPGLLSRDIKLNSCELPAHGTAMSGALLGNTTAIREVLARIGKQFRAMFRHKAFLHWYTREGMDEADFVEAKNYMKSMIMEYNNRE